MRVLTKLEMALIKYRSLLIVGDFELRCTRLTNLKCVLFIETGCTILV